MEGSRFRHSVTRSARRGITMAFGPARRCPR